MPRDTNQLAPFIAACRRRIALVRSAERIGLCILVGSILSLLIVPLLAMTNRAASPILILTAITAISAAAGVAWSVRRWPTLLHAAGQADRQLDLDDLLATAWQLAHGDRHGRPVEATPAWAATIEAIAADRCRRLSPESLVLGRLGARGWSGIGVALALAVVVSLFVAGPPNPAQADGVAVSPAGLLTNSANPRSIPGLSGTTAARSERPALSNSSTDASRIIAPEDSALTTHSDMAGRAAGQNAAANSGAASGGIGRTSAMPSAPPSPAIVSGHPDNSTPSAHTGPPAAGGASASSPNPTAADLLSGAAPGINSQTRAAAPWQSPQWAADRDAVRNDLSTGHVPDDVRDLVKDYFDLAADPAQRPN
jgi:hypothetical protein